MKKIHLFGSIFAFCVALPAVCLVQQLSNTTNNPLRTQLNTAQTTSPTSVVTTFDQLDTITIDHEHEMVFGRTGNFTGHFGPYAKRIEQGIATYFNTVNATGGIDGKRLRLISIEDDGDPKNAERNVSALLKQKGIDMYLGVMGTRRVLKILPMIKEKKIAMVFP